MPHFVHGPKQMRAHSAGAKAELDGDLLERHVFVMPQPEDELLLRRECSFCPLDGGP